MKILHIAAEVSPFVSVGGLSQVMYFLPSALIKKGHDARVFTPKYGTSKIKKRWKKKKQILPNIYTVTAIIAPRINNVIFLLA